MSDRHQFEGNEHNDTKEGREMSPEEQAELSRRAFLRRTAEVAALSLFGPMALDTVVRRVARRVAEIDALDGMAREAAEYLAQNGLGGIAYAHEWCQPHCVHQTQDFGGCKLYDNPPFSCTPNTTPSFHCQLDAQGRPQFQCIVHDFSCGELQGSTFACNNFHCGTPNEEGAGYLCRTEAAYTRLTCATEAQVTCNPQWAFTNCNVPVACDGQTVQVRCGNEADRFNAPCSNQQGGYECPDGDGFDCGAVIIFTCDPGQGNGGFSCGMEAGNGGFSCGGEEEPTLDFFCIRDFDCADHSNFQCQGNHIFACGNPQQPNTPGTFTCHSRTQGQDFDCGAGGTQCNQPGVGGYGGGGGADQPGGIVDPRPGDFVCVGLNANRFTCESAQTNFTCEGTFDDFRCVGQPGNFNTFGAQCTANAPFDGNAACQMTEELNPGGIFACTGDEGFQCGGSQEQRFQCSNIFWCEALPTGSGPFYCSQAQGNFICDPVPFSCQTATPTQYSDSVSPYW